MSELMTRSEALTEDDLRAVAAELAWRGKIRRGRRGARPPGRAWTPTSSSAHASGVMFTPTFFINGRRYDGPWDESSLSDAMLGTLGHRVRSAALDFASWARRPACCCCSPRSLAVAITNSALGPGVPGILAAGRSASRSAMPPSACPAHWVNDGLLTIFFLVVGLEIKREFTVGHLASRRSAALPIAAAIGGMVVPAGLYMVMIPEGPWAHGWGVPMATDTAFAVALIVMMGRRVPIELRIFLTAAAIVDDIGAIVVIAVFYSGELASRAISAAAAAIAAALALLNRSRVYSLSPYMLLGVALWACVHAGGLHATPRRGAAGAVHPDPTAAGSERPDGAGQHDRRCRSAPSRRGAAARPLAAGAARAGCRSTIGWNRRLPACCAMPARAPVTWCCRCSRWPMPAWSLTPDVVSGHGPLMLAIIVGLVIGKPLGMVLACALAVRLGVAVKPEAYSWRQVAGAGALAGIGFTMSLFIAGRKRRQAGEPC